MEGALGFLHTAAAHVSTFRSLVAEFAPHARVVDIVDAELLARARRDGAEASTVADGIAARLDQLAEAGARRIVCTCSTLGGLAERIGHDRGFDVVRVDRAMAERAVEIGGRVVVLATLEDTLGPTGRLLADVASEAGHQIELRFLTVSGAWDRFEAGDHEGVRRLVAESVLAVEDDADVIVLAQASMAAAAAVDARIPVLSSPRCAVAALVAGPESGR